VPAADSQQKSSSIVPTWPLAASVGAALVLAGSAASAHTNAAPVLSVQGSPLRVEAGATATIQLDARDPDRADTVHISALFLPPRASLKARDGNPARATFRWRPPSQGSYVVTFTAQDHGSPHLAVTKTIKVLVHSKPESVSNAQVSSSWSFVTRAVPVRSEPSPAAGIVASLGTRTPEGTQNLVLLLQRVTQANGSEWYRIRLPVLPNNSTGWVPAVALDGLHVVSTHLVVDRQALTATLYRRGRAIFKTPVGVGQDRYPTPGGEFYIRDLVIGYTDPTYGPAAFGTSARSRVLTDWPDGGYIGIHGTSQPSILPGRVSHGCIRMPNTAIAVLRRLMPVGTPLTIR
jgi:hypothetical protein